MLYEALQPIDVQTEAI